ncbi:MAG: GNAT family N-acetyltransferase [Polyangiaceae bacterium]|nr:GNAT family N-acetyltransferase [Polyangiaceae bacterium]
MATPSSPPRERRRLPLAMRKGQLELTDLSGSEFMSLVSQQARSEESGSISSQYERELCRGDTHVGALGVRACDAVVGAISYGKLALPRHPGKVSLRIDVVVTRRHCRKMGIGALLIAALINKFAKELGPNLHHVSVMAVHPAMIQVFSKLNFERAAPNVPLYSRLLNERELLDMQRQTDGIVNLKLRDLKALCVPCRRFERHAPWCAAEG